jgi:hypothetical protein
LQSKLTSCIKSAIFRTVFKISWKNARANVEVMTDETITDVACWQLNGGACDIMVWEGVIPHWLQDDRVETRKLEYDALWSVELVHIGERQADVPVARYSATFLVVALWLVETYKDERERHRPIQIAKA